MHEWRGAKNCWCLTSVLFALTILASTRSACSASHKAEEFPWLRDDTYDAYGQEDRVLKPWTPVEVGNRRIAVWGRVMKWHAESILPASITSQGAELLAGPMRLVITHANRQYVVPLDHWRIRQHKKSQATIVARGRAAGTLVEAEILAEYDGFLLITLRFPGQATCVDALRIIASMPAGSTTLYQTFARPLAGWIGDTPIKLSWLAGQSQPVERLEHWRPSSEPIANFYHWLGNEDRGLGFTYLTLQHWAPETENNFCTISRSSDRRNVIYTVNLIERPVSLLGRVFQVGLQATPIKPLPPDYHSMMTTSWRWEEWCAMRQFPHNLDMVIIWPPGIMKGLNDPYHINAEPLERMVQRCHELSIPVLFSGCPQKISPFNDEFEAWKEEWMNLPESVLDWDGKPHYQNCGRSYTLRKWLFYGWTKQVVERFKLDGIYFDGWQAGTMACHNERHGCGWTDEKGQRHLTVPVMEGREFNKRLAAWLEDHVQSEFVPPQTAPPRPDFPKYHWRIHSWEFVPPLMGFATCWLTGEFTGWPLKGISTQEPEGTFGQCLGLGHFRARCLSTNWGLPNLFHVLIWEAGENPPRARQTHMAYAWLLPHGVPVGETVYMNRHVVASITKAMMDFSTRRATFTPCWRKNPYWRIEYPRSPEVVLATWAHPHRYQVLTVLSNLQVRTSASISLRWQPTWQPRLTNALTGQPLQLINGHLHVRLKPETFLLFKAEG